MGRHKRFIGWTENPLKLQKFKRSDQADCGFSIGTWKSFNTRKWAKSIFQPRSTRPLLEETASQSREARYIEE